MSPTSASSTSRWRRPLSAVLAALVAVLAVVGVRAFSAVRAHGSGAADPGLSAEVRAVIPELEAFVEQARGLKFLSPVKVSVLGDAAFRRKYDEGNSTDSGGPDVEGAEFRALGLDTGSGQAGSGSADEADSVDGYYDSDTKELVVRGTKPTPFVRQVLVHELTHALDDQHFGIDPDVVDDEAGMADDALVEGDATAIEYRYVDAMTPEDRRAAAAEDDAASGGSAAPDAFDDLADFPYTDGPGFIAALVAAGGQARVDDAFRVPPTTSAEILHPERYLAGRGRADVPPVAADGKVVDDGVLGEYLIGLILEESVPMATAERAAAGWAGDHYVAWRPARRTICVRTTVVLDSAAEAAELTSALRAWAADHRGATVDAGAAAAVTFGRCG